MKLKAKAENLGTFCESGIAASEVRGSENELGLV
jgi:hypothetical protein